MKSFLNNALATINDTIADLDKAFNDFDFDRTLAKFTDEGNTLIEKGKNWMTDMGDFLKEVHETMADLKVEVPYDKEKDTIEYTTDNGTFSVKVKSNDNTYSKSIDTTIPENALIGKMTQEYDADNKKMVFTIPKKKDLKAIKNEKIQKLLDSYQDKKEALKKQLKAEIDKVQKENGTDDEPAPTGKSEFKATVDKKGSVKVKRQ